MTTSDIFAPGAAIVGAAVAAVLTSVAAHAADLGGNCCADLEERIAELEASTARKGNRKVSLTVAGQVNRAVLFWDDGVESDAYSVGNKNDQTNFSFVGDAEISAGLRAGYALVIRVEDNLSDGVDQNVADAGRGFQLWESNWWIESETFGRLAVGVASRVSDTAPETDLSETGVAGYAGVQDVPGGFIIRRGDGALSGLTYGDVYFHLNGDTANAVRYDTPSFAGFVASVSWGEDDLWDVGLRYAGEGGGFQVEGVIAYSEVTDAPSDFADVANSVVVGSFSILHEPSGLNVTMAAGSRMFDAAALDADGRFRTPAEQTFVYAKLGWIASQLSALGPTAFYGEYGWFRDFVSVVDDVAVVDSVSAVAGSAARIKGSEAEVWGAGVVQNIEAAEMQLYLGYRHHEVGFDVVDGAGAAVGAASLEDFDTVLTGAKISF